VELAGAEEDGDLPGIVGTEGLSVFGDKEGHKQTSRRKKPDGTTLGNGFRLRPASAGSLFRNQVHEAGQGPDGRRGCRAGRRAFCAGHHHYDSVNGLYVGMLDAQEGGGGGLSFKPGGRVDRALGVRWLAGQIAMAHRDPPWRVLPGGVWVGWRYACDEGG